MIAVIFEVAPEPPFVQEYLDLAAGLRAELDTIDGFLSVERYASLSRPGYILSLSFWRDEDAVAHWRQSASHRQAQVRGRDGVFQHYRLRVAHVVRDYGKRDRDAAPPDARAVHG